MVTSKKARAVHELQHMRVSNAKASADVVDSRSGPSAD